jgi:hypothetical protein
MFRSSRAAAQGREPLISDIASPPVKVGFQCRPALKAPSGNCVLLHITDATLVFPFGARPVGGTSVRPKTPMLGKGVQPSIKLDLSGRPVMTHHQPAIIVEQHLFGDPTEVAECALDTRKPALLAPDAGHCPNYRAPYDTN